ncbi:MAG: helix-turn-helix domain-containing protein [Acidimicrobiia bacterium]
MTEREPQRLVKRRLAIIQHAEEVTGNVAQVCRYFGISRQTFYYWLHRYEEKGLDGVQNRIEPLDPVDKDIYDLPPAELKNLPSVPGSLDEALAALEEDHEFLLQGGVFTEDLIEAWISYKTEHEVEPVKLRPHPYEFHLYYDI